MAVNHQHFLESARVLLSGLSEMDYRNAASRSYYAAYHLCLNLGRRFPDYLDEKSGVHERLILKLENARDKKIKAVGYILRGCKGSRSKADYFLEDKFSKQEAELAIKQVEKLIQKYSEIEKN